MSVPEIFTTARTLLKADCEKANHSYTWIKEAIGNAVRTERHGLFGRRDGSVFSRFSSERETVHELHKNQIMLGEIHTELDTWVRYEPADKTDGFVAHWIGVRENDPVEWSESWIAATSKFIPWDDLWHFFNQKKNWVEEIGAPFKGFEKYRPLIYSGKVGALTLIATYLAQFSFHLAP